MGITEKYHREIGRGQPLECNGNEFGFYPGGKKEEALKILKITQLDSRLRKITLIEVWDSVRSKLETGRRVKRLLMEARRHESLY